MNFKRNFKIAVVYLMSMVISNAPQLAAAETAKSLTMIPTNSFVIETSEAQAQENISNFLNRSDVQTQLMAQGLSHEEASLRIAALSKSELNLLSSQINEARAGGDILVTILLIILIIFLVKRI